MKDLDFWLTPKQAGELSGYTARHIQNLITSGKLSATREDGRYYIDKSEFFRVFPSAFKKEQQGNPAKNIAEKERLEFENTILKDTAAKKDKEIEFLRNQIDFISQEKVKLLDAITSTARVLENKSNSFCSEKIDKTTPSQKRIWRHLFGLSKKQK